MAPESNKLADAQVVVIFVAFAAAVHAENSEVMPATIARLQLIAKLYYAVE